MPKDHTLFLLGTVRIHDGQNQIDKFRSNRAMALLIYLVNQNHPVPRSELIELIWPDKPLDKGRGNLRWALNYLSKLLPDCWEVTRQTAMFRPAPGWQVDVLSLQEALAADDIVGLETAAADAQAEFCRGFYFNESPEFETWLLTRREYWRERLSTIWQRLIDHYQQKRAYDRALFFARQLLTLDTWQEKAHRQLMLLLARTGDLNGALFQYETCRRILAQELGVEPQTETTQLHERIRNLRNLDKPALPLQPTPLFGRESEVDHVVEMLSDGEERLVTVWGLGGVGKTRLTMAIAEKLKNAFLEGVYFVPLASAGDAVALKTAVARALKIQLQGAINGIEQITAFLQDKELLLVLDNFEQLVSEASVLEEILRQAPEVRIVVTSRERLQLRWEKPFLLTGLTYPESTADLNWQTASGVQLFLEAAARAVPNFDLSPADEAHILQICRLVQGLPLALELAAAWLRVQSCAEIASQIQSDLDALSSMERGIPQRQRSLRTIFDAAYHHLPPAAQKSFAYMGLFEGEFSADAAAVIAEASPQICLALADTALLRPVLSAKGDNHQQKRFSLHSLVRQYALEKIAEDSKGKIAAGKRHSGYYLSGLGEVTSQLQRGHDQGNLLASLQRDIDNIRAAWRWAVANHKVDLLITAVEGLQVYYELQGPFQEGVLLIELAITQFEEAGSPDDTLALCKLYLAISYLETHLGQFSQAVESAGKGLALAQENQLAALAAEAKYTSSLAFLRLGRQEEAQKYLSEAFAEAQALNLGRIAAYSAQHLANMAFMRSEYDLAEQEYVKAEALFTQIDDLQGSSIATHNRALILQERGRLTEAQTLLLRALDDFERTGNKRGISSTLHNLGIISQHQSNMENAALYFEEALNIRRQIGDRAGEALTLNNLAFISRDTGEFQTAHLYASEALSIAQQLGVLRTECYARITLGLTEIGLGRYSNGWHHFEQTLEKSRVAQLTLVEARARRGLGWTAYHLGLYAASKTYLYTAYKTISDLGNEVEKRWATGNLAELFLTMNDFQSAQMYIDEMVSDHSYEPDRNLRSYAYYLQARLFYLQQNLTGVEDFFARLSQLWEKDAPLVDPRTTMAAAYLQAGQIDKSVEQVEKILFHLSQNLEVTGVDDPAQTHIICYQVLNHKNDKRGSDILKSGHQLLQQRASRIRDEHHRTAYLENVASNRTLVQIYQDRVPI
ncbi:MAG: tetratricopeptide repeat protein [Ardenticatenaceae bacterium]|nr:tetratricopeptide repeat protein [Ardenticatenaceae bacterium]